MVDREKAPLQDCRIVKEEGEDGTRIEGLRSDLSQDNTKWR